MLQRIREREIKLAVDSSGAAAFYEYLTNQRTIGGLALVGSEDRRFRDSYFDTPDLLLWNTGGYLRLRHGPTQSVATLRVSRGPPSTPNTVELSRPVGQLPVVVNELIRQFSSFGPMPEDISAPELLIEQIGLEQIVSLSNERRVLFVQPQSLGRRYRVKLDKVTYDIWGLMQYEIELDVYDRQGLTWAADVVRSLLTQAPGVRLTTSTKLDRGLVLRELFDAWRSQRAV